MTLRQLFKSDKSQQIQKAKYYSDLDISAKLFYDNLGNEDLSFLIISGKPSNEELEKAYDKLYDLYFEKKNDRKARLILKTKNKIVLLSYKIAIAKQALKFLCICPLTGDQFQTLVKSIKKHLKINIDPKKETVNEVHRVLTMQIPSWETNLKLEESNFDGLRKGKASTFEYVMDSINDAKQYKAIDRNTTLIEFIEAEKREIEKSKKRKQEESKKGRKR